MQTLKTFATGLRAASLVDDLKVAGINAAVLRNQAQLSLTRWTNKRLPPPNVIVSVADVDFEKASQFLKEWE